VTLMVARYGLLAIVAFEVTFMMFFFAPMPTETSWYTAVATIPTAFLLLLAIWAFRTSLGGQSPWHAALLDE
jgi:hypothetical protein